MIDDPHSPDDAWSDAGRESTLKFVRGSLFSRLDHPGHDSIVVCHARLHDDDLIGVLRDPDRGNDAPRPKTEEAVNEPPTTGYEMFTDKIRV